MTRIGMVNYINTAPIYEVWKERVDHPDWEVIEAPPSRLNKLLATGAVDLGFISSYEYCARPSQYMILSDLSISATGPVGSVFLFASCAPEDLGNRRILLTGQSDTSIYLVKIILEEFFAVQPRYTVGEIFEEQDALDGFDGILAIGDEALRLSLENPYQFRLDLGEIWQRHTDLPFVFSVCAVREAYLAHNEEDVRQVHQTLLACREEGLNRLPEISERVAQRIPMDREACSLYLQGIEYDLGPVKQMALERFLNYLIQRKEAAPKALPLKIF